MLLTWCRQLVNRKYQAVARSQRAGARRKRGQRPQLERLEDRLTPSTHTWTGAQNSLWSNDSNWNGNSPRGDPVADLVFPQDGVTNRTSTDDILGPIPIQSMTLDGNAFLLNGVNNAYVYLLGDILANLPGDNTISLNIDLAPEAAVISAGTLTFSGQLSGRGGVVKSGAGQVVLSGHNTYSGPTTVLYGQLRAGVVDAIPEFSDVTVSDPGQVDFNGLDAAIGSLSGDGRVFLNFGRLTTGNHEIDTTLSGQLIGFSGLVKTGVGTFTLSGVNSFFAGELAINGGGVQLGTTDALGSEVRVSLRAAYTWFDLENFQDTIADLSGVRDSSVYLGYGTLTVGAGTFRGSMSDNGLGHLNKRGTGLFTLEGDNTVSLTTVTAGTLAIWGLQPDSPVVIQSGSILRGRGTTGSLYVSGTVYPSGAALKTGSATFYAGSSFQVQLSGTAYGAYDRLEVNGTVDLSGSPTLNASLGFVSQPRDEFTILTSTGGITGTFAGLPNGANFGVNGTPMRINYTANSVVLTHRPQFLPPVRYAASAGGEGPSFVAVGDFRGNGFNDLVVANRSYVTVLLNDGHGAFGEPVPYAVHSEYVVVGKFNSNNDGNLDIVTVSSFAGAFTLSVLLGNGDGTFGHHSTVTLDRRAYGIAVGDFNGDGKLDLVTANSDDSSVSVLLGNGDGTFIQSSIDVSPSRPQSVAVADFNGDGKLDIVTANYSSSTVSVLLGNGDGTFQREPDFTVNRPYYLAVGDFNGDGKLDLVSTTFDDPTVSVLLGNGDGTFVAAPSVYVGDQLGAIAVGDFNGDGKLDFVVKTGFVGNYSRLALLYGQGDGSFQAPTYYLLPGTSKHLAVGSFQGRGDRFPDVAVINEDVVSVLLNVGDGSAPAPGPSPGPRRPTTAVGRFPPDAFLLLAGPDASLTASPYSDAATTGAIRSLRALPPVLDVAGVDLFYAAAAEDDYAFSRPRSRREAWLGADDWWVTDLGKDGALVDRTLWALRSA
jgi:autotransporter-associated beta strand protein